MINLLIGVHNHQPVGNFDHVIDYAHRMAYHPFIEVLKQHPEIKVSIHFSGILYDWFEHKHRDYLDLLKELAGRGQLEIVGGGYYEPIIATLPHKDQRGQIIKMQEYIHRTFGQKPAGMWLAERVWEPQLAAVLADAGVEYTVLDDIHFFSSGFSEHELTGYYTTEFEGKNLKVLPINQRLRYLMPFADPERTIDYLRQFADKGDCALVMADDGEKFGLWPQTYDLIYNRRWLDRMFSLIEANRSWLRTETFSNYISGRQSKGMAYLPTTSYYELSQWALPPQSANTLADFYKQTPEHLRRFLRGSYFRNFFAKYPESNNMYRKMLHVSGKIHASCDSAGVDNLWKSQCNCGYWHGVFGGLYLPHIRRENYKNLISAENAVDGGKQGFTSFEADWDGDGKNELFAESANGNWHFVPASGGALREWDWKAGAVNWINVLSRRPESYHEAVARAIPPGQPVPPGAMPAKEPDLAKKIFYDWHQRMCLLDHFLLPGNTLDSFARVHYGEQGDFIKCEYSVKSFGQENDKFKIALERTGGVWIGDVHVPVHILKTVYLFENGVWEASYEITNKSANPCNFHFGTELALGFSQEKVCGQFSEENINGKTFHDDVNGNLRISFDGQMDLWAFPLKTVSQSEEGFEQTYQGSVLLCHKRLSLGPGETFRFKLLAEAFK